MNLGKYRGRAVNALTGQINKRENSLQSKIGLYTSDCGTLIEDDVTAIWDTGAASCVIDNRLAQKCGLIPVSRSMIRTVGGTIPSYIYNLSLKLPNNILVPNILVYSGDVFGGSMLIGMNVFKMGDFSITTYQGETLFTFRVPSLEKIDYVKEVNISNTVNKKKQVAKKSKCPCNSGKQYKDCCAKNT